MGYNAAMLSALPVALRLSLYWFCAMGALGVYFPYFSLYLKENVGLSGGEVGVIVAIPPLVGIVMQPTWGQLADRTGDRTRVLALLCAGAGLGYLALMLPDDFASMALSAGFLALFVSSINPMGVSTSMAALDGRGAVAFGRVRVWGTIGYLCTVVAAPPLLSALERARGLTPTEAVSEPALGLAFVLATALIWLAALCALSLPRTGALSARASREEFRALLRQRAYLKLLLFNFGGFLVLHGPMILFPIYVRSRGGDMGDLSRLWIWMLLLEIPMVAYSGPLFERLGARTMICAALFAGGVRWVVCASTAELAHAYPVQVLHAITIGGLLIGGALYVERLVPIQLRSTAQAGLTMTSALGGILSSSLGGVLLDAAGVDALYYAGGVGAVSWGALAALSLPRPSAERADYASSASQPRP
ncbi:MAG: MFS transporter [Myxococcales bacterium]|jgi:PPP family 3-phenylpropionic acid transporter